MVAFGGTPAPAPATPAMTSAFLISWSVPYKVANVSNLHDFINKYMISTLTLDEISLGAHDKMMNNDVIMFCRPLYSTAQL